MKAKTEARERARELRRQGRTYDEIVEEPGVARDRLRFAVSIHESADVSAAERYWADRVGVAVEALQKTTLKRRNPKTVRKNVGEGYRGCLRVAVAGSADLYRRVEGWWCGIVVAATRRGR